MSPARPPRSPPGRCRRVELVAGVLERISRYDGRLNAFTTVLGEEALAEAAARDAQAGERGPLHGVPVAIKEELDVAGRVTTFGGRGNATPAAADAEVVRRLRAAGAVVVGKTNMPEFGQWPFTESVAHGITRNPWDTRRSPGGSSGGTAAAVAAGLVPFGSAVTAAAPSGSRRACCGLYGLKPQRGRVTMAPHAHGWWALSTTGPLTRSVRDSAVVYDVLRGTLPVDRWSAREPATSFTAAVGRAVRAAADRLVDEAGDARRAARPRARRRGARDREPARLPRPPRRGGRPRLPRPHRRVRAAVLRRRAHRRRRARAPGPARAPHPGDRAASAGGSPRGSASGRSGRASRCAGRPTGSSSAATCCSPRRSRTGRRTVGVLDGVGTVRAALLAMPMIAYTALWNVTGNPAASVPAGFGPTGCPPPCSWWGGRATRRRC